MKPKLPRVPLPRQSGGAHNRMSRSDQRNIDRAGDDDILDWLLEGMVRTVDPETGEVWWVMRGDKDVV